MTQQLDTLVATQAAADRTVKRLFRLLEVLPDADLRFVFDAIVACESDLDVAGHDPVDGEHSEPWELSRWSLGEAVRDLGSVPSKRRYIDWRETQSDPAMYATGSMVLRVLGDGAWNAAGEKLGAPAVDVTARRLLSNGRRFSVEECSVALNLFGAAVPPEARTTDAYETWAIEHVQRGGGPRVPLCAETIVRKLKRRWRDLRDDLAPVEAVAEARIR